MQITYEVFKDEIIRFEADFTWRLLKYRKTLFTFLYLVFFDLFHKS